MTHSTRPFSRRLCGSAIYSLHLAGEVSNPGWMMQVDRGRLLAAIDAVAASASPKGRRRRSAQAVTLVVCELGISVRSGSDRRDIAGFGFWASPILVSGARLRSVAGSLEGPDVDLGFSDGRLTADWKSIKAREL